MRSNQQLLKALRTPVARFYPFDLHVHSVASADTCIGERFAQLPAGLQALLSPLDKEPADPAAYDASTASRVPVETYYKCLLDRRDEVSSQAGQPESDNWAIVAITDHNTAEYSALLSRHAWNRRKQDRLLILPGMELEVQFPIEPGGSLVRVHLLCIFAPNTSASDIRVAVNAAVSREGQTWKLGSPLPVKDLPAFVSSIRSHQQYPAICIAAHVWSSKGVAKTSRDALLDSLSAEIARIEGALQYARGSERTELEQRRQSLQAKVTESSALDMEILRLIGKCGFDALQIRDQRDETHYRRLHRFREEHGRATPIVCSDAHTPSLAFDASGGIPYAKLSRLPVNLDEKGCFDELRGRVLRFGETRTTYTTPARVTQWIEGIEIVPDAKEARRFWPFAVPPAVPEDNPPEKAPSFLLPLSRNLNCLVGGRGSGKSAAVEAIAFISKAEEFDVAARSAQRQWPEWYSRARSTLNGCQVRMIWKSTATDSIGSLPKRALFLSRYFDPSNRHQRVEHRDAQGQAVVDSSVVPPAVSIFRVHEIEQTAEPDKLRGLFDNLCGVRIADLNAQVDQLKTMLRDQRGEIIELCETLAELTAEGGPLRQYAIRKRQFDEVNRPDIRDKYEAVDIAESTSKTSASVVESWESLEADSSLATIEAKVTDFLTETAPTIENADGTPKTGLEHLHALLVTPTEQNPSQYNRSILAPIGEARLAATRFDEQLRGLDAAVKTSVEAARNELTKTGLPPGARDRESKKRAYDEASSALGKYREYLTILANKLAERGVTHAALVTACQERTRIRQETAQALTAQLGQDLDSAVLKIEVDARPVADCRQLLEWLDRALKLVFPRSRAERCQALVEKDIMPADIREILLHEAGANRDVFRVDKARADEGRITDTEVSTIVAACQAKQLVPLQGDDGSWDDAFRQTLPEEIRAGIWTFPTNDVGANSLRIDNVLQLDEIVLDDLPEVRLNDRPTDPQSVARPLSELSPGQRCSAILPVLLLSGDTPLIIDQPEENLDNRLIRQVIVNILASMKLRRQVIMATHNPNLPVLGDAEQCVILQATGRDQSAVLATGDLDAPEVARYITDIMEGGREAFQYRQSIYQTHWDSVVEASQEGPPGQDATK